MTNVPHSGGREGVEKTSLSSVVTLLLGLCLWDEWWCVGRGESMRTTT